MPKFSVVVSRVISDVLRVTVEVEAASWIEAENQALVWADCKEGFWDGARRDSLDSGFSEVDVDSIEELS